MNFGEVIISFVVGWLSAMASTWLILAKPWLDRRMLPKSNGNKAGANQNQLAAPVSINTGPVKIV